MNTYVKQEFKWWRNSSIESTVGSEGCLGSSNELILLKLWLLLLASRLVSDIVGDGTVKQKKSSFLFARFSTSQLYGRAYYHIRSLISRYTCTRGVKKLEINVCKHLRRKLHTAGRVNESYKKFVSCSIHRSGCLFSHDLKKFSSFRIRRLFFACT